MTTIVIGEDHAMLRENLRALLAAQPDFCVVGVTGDHRELLEMVAQLGPDVILLDLALPGLGGAGAIGALARASPDTRVIVVSSYEAPGYALEAFQGGAAGYIVIGSPSDLFHGIREVAAGRPYLSPPLSEAALEDHLRRADGGLQDPRRPGTS